MRLAPDAAVPGWALKGQFSSITRTTDELSIVCLKENVLADISTPPNWACLKLEGPFPFSLTGVLLSFIEPLSCNGIPIFAISTYDTDYVLIKANDLARAVATLRAAGHRVDEAG